MSFRYVRSTNGNGIFKKFCVLMEPETENYYGKKRVLTSINSNHERVERERYQITF
jgi:hypothetical protein